MTSTDQRTPTRLQQGVLPPAPTQRAAPRTALILADPRVRAVALMLLAAWGAYQCLWNLTGRNIAGDEQVYMTAGWDYVHGDFTQNLEHPPTAKYLYGLAQLVFGQGILGPRLVVSLMAFAAGIILLLWLRAEVGWWAGLAAAGVWWIMPRGGASPRVDRSAMLDPVMTFFALAALVAAWALARSGRLWWAPLSAALMALSVTSKVSAAVILPTFLIILLLLRDRPKVLIRASLLWASTFAISVVALYAPLGMVRAVRYMVKFQGEHNASGHSVIVAGDIYQFPPWWTHLWYLKNGLGPVLLVVVVVGVLAAVAIRPNWLVAYLGVPVVLLGVFYLGISKVALGFYYYAFTPFLVALAVIGYAQLLKVGPTLATRIVVLAACVAVVVPSAQMSHSTWVARPSGVALVPAVLDAHGVGSREKVLFIGVRPSNVRPYLAGRGTTEVSRGPFAAIVEGADPRELESADTLHDLIADHPDRFRSYPAGNLVVWIPDGEVQAKRGVLRVE